MALSVLFFGDIVGRPGREALLKVLPELKEETKADLVIANAENAAHGNGVSQKVIDELMAGGVNAFTTGDHAFDRKDSYAIYDNKDMPLVRPGNYPPGAPGRGWHSLTVGATNVVIMNLIGRVFLKDNYDDPFRGLDEMLKAVPKGSVVLLDFHAEATSEKIAMGWHANGRVAAILGTHTHVQTADERILPNGTPGRSGRGPGSEPGAAYISDLGMCGPIDGVLGVNRDIILYKFLSQMSRAHEIEERGPSIVSGVHIIIDPGTKKATSIKRISTIVPATVDDNES